MFNTQFFVRVLVAVLVGAILILMIPALLALIGFPAGGNLLLVIKLAIVAIIILYIFRG